MILARSAVITKLEEGLTGTIDAGGLAAWAFDCYYAIEQGQLRVEPADTDLIAAILDELMFADEPSFALDEADLRRLIARLQEP